MYRLYLKWRRWCAVSGRSCQPRCLVLGGEVKSYPATRQDVGPGPQMVRMAFVASGPQGRGAGRSGGWYLTREL